MAYRKEDIDQAKKLGVFDNNTLDPAILGLDDEEKARLARELKEQGRPPADALPDDEDAPDGERASPAVTLGLWERICFFFQKIFMGLTLEEFIRKNALRDIQDRVKHYRPPLWQPYGGKVTGQLGTLIFKLATLASAYQKMITFCQGAQLQEADSALRFTEFLLSRFVEELPDLEKKFGYSYVKNNSGLFIEKRIRETLEKEIDAGLKSIPHEQRVLANSLYAGLIAYGRIAEFNFYSLLRKFGQGLTKFDEGFPDFSPVEGTAVLAELRKLEDLLFAVDPGLDLGQMFSAVGMFYNSLRSGRADDLPQWTDKDFAALQEAVQALLEGDRLTNLIRLISQKPEHLPKIRTYQVSLLDEVRHSLLSRQLPRCQALVHQVEVDNLNLKIKDIFGTDPLATLDFYNEQTNKKLAEYGLPLFTNSRYLQIVKTYHERLFAVLIKPALNIVVVDGSFFDKLLYGRLGDYFYKYDEVNAALADFEKKISPSTKEGEKLLALFHNYSGDPPTKKVITEKIHYLNNLSAKIIREAAERLGSVLPALQAIVQDAFGGSKPEFLLNVKQLGGSRNRAIIKAVQKAADATALVHGILAPFC